MELPPPGFASWEASWCSVAHTEQRHSPHRAAFAGHQPPSRRRTGGQKALKSPSQKQPDLERLGSGLSQLWENRAASKTLRSWNEISGVWLPVENRELEPN